MLVEAVSGDKGGLGYFGLSYYDQNTDRLNALEIDDGGGCVAPTQETIQNGTYKPLSRPLFVYANREALAREEVRSFLQFMLDNQDEIAGKIFVAADQASSSQSRRTRSRTLRNGTLLI